ncbi:hypothetical protein HRI97_03080 [Treponema socranskii subsp. buccale]|uniref:hypothetical protein n=1 Tax=Treponema socranskii TaxID=53419 RepID=UPI0020676393|nr:hypothetical protein [Treponema socranskii]UTD02120.1 hypothetical protein HRI97_03080 [Treponema socranskii subsp. buccale]DAW66657.1 MAG TPA: protein of unknown function (UPF0154) [Caudoviricetes sp.]
MIALLILAVIIGAVLGFYYLVWLLVKAVHKRLDDKLPSVVPEKIDLLVALGLLFRKN